MFQRGKGRPGTLRAANGADLEHLRQFISTRSGVEAYLNFVADRLDLRRDIRFDTNVVAMTFDESAAEWDVRTESGESFTAPFVVAAAGILSAPLEPDIASVLSAPGRRACS